MGLKIILRFWFWDEGKTVELLITGDKSLVNIVRDF